MGSPRHRLLQAALAVAWLGGCSAPPATMADAPAATVTRGAPVSVAYDQQTGTFRGTKLATVQLAMRAIQEKGWKIEQVNEGIGMVSFETGISMGSWSGITANIILEEISPNNFRVSGTAKQNLRGGQVAAFNIGGEAQNAVNEAIAQMRVIAQSR